MLSELKTRLYKYDSVKMVKERLRPVKHFLFGINDIYRWLAEIRHARQGACVTTVFDVGAAVGDKTITFLRCFPGCTVYCFEPLRSFYERLLARTAPYKNRVKPFNFGFYNKDSDMPLRVTSYEYASSILPLQGLENKSIRETVFQPVQLRTIDGFVAEQKIAHIDLIKIDVEGVEKEVLEGASKTLSDKVDNVIVEISPLRKGPLCPDYIRVFEYLHNGGFSFIGCDVDYFFTKDEHVLRKYFDPHDGQASVAHQVP